MPLQLNPDSAVQMAAKEPNEHSAAESQPRRVKKIEVKNVFDPDRLSEIWSAREDWGSETEQDSRN